MDVDMVIYPGINMTTNNLYIIQEVVFAGAGMIAWMLVCGIGGTISQRTIIETGERFGWIAVRFFYFTISFLNLLGVLGLRLSGIFS